MTAPPIEMLLCGPEIFSVDYEINPWMDVNDPARCRIPNARGAPRVAPARLAA
jgi:hypothetical protein